jgi:polyphosphate kinase 2 (PPK2 family)
VVVLKFFLHLSRGEQRQRFLARLDSPEKHWKFSSADVRERRHWDRYQHAYQEAIRHTATPWAPWLVVPADHKWFTRLVVAAAVVQALESLELAFPSVAEEAQAGLSAARAELEAEPD